MKEQKNAISIWKKLLTHFVNVKENIHHQVTPTEIELIKKSHLFDTVSQDDFDKLSKSFTVVKYMADDLIIKEGDISDALYIIVSGSVRVFTVDVTKQKIYLARLEEGEFFGEQGLLDKANKTRNANIEAITDTTLIKISDAVIAKLLSSNVKLKEKLKKIGSDQLFNNFTQICNVYQIIKHNIMTATGVKHIEYPDGATIFSVGDIADYIYFILKGNVEISFPKMEGQNLISITLNKGHLFGEMSIIQRARRSSNAIARDHVVLLALSANLFQNLYQEHPQLKKLVTILQKTYQLPKIGLIEQYIGKPFNVDTFTTIYNLEDKRIVIATRTINDDYFTMTTVGDTQNYKTYTYQKNSESKTELSVVDNYIMEIKSYGDWDDLHYACQMLLKKQKVTPEVLEQFVKERTLAPAAQPKEKYRNELICECMSVSRGTLLDLIESGVNQFSALSDATGAGTVCGCCQHKILEMLGQSAWFSATLSPAVIHNENVRSYYITLNENKFNVFSPGQYVIIQVKMHDYWLERAYTISNYKIDDIIRITMKRKATGAMTKWLFEHITEPIMINVTQPQGEFNLEMNEAVALCFAGGIGVTPYLSYLEFLSKQQSGKRIHIYYCASGNDDFILLDEINAFIKNLPSVSLELRDTSKVGHLTKEDVLNKIEQFNHPDVYICGPEGFEENIHQALKSIGYAANKIHIEKFTYTAPIVLDDTKQ